MRQGRAVAIAAIGLAATVAAGFCRVAHAWHDEGHVYAARAAIEAMPDDAPAFFRGRDAATAVAHAALDPDVIRNRALPQLRNADAPEHYIDLEYLQGRDLPATRYAFIALCEELGVEPAKAGTLPYAIAERAQWLTVAFAEHRRWPDNEHVKMKCLVLAGILAHYTADLHMPLHTTLHFDGVVPEAPAEEDGATVYLHSESKHAKGIHARVDALPTKIPYAELFPQPVTPPEPRAELFAYVVNELKKSHALVDRVYALEPQIPAMAELSLQDAEVRQFTIDRMQAAAAFTAGVYLSAWRHSADLELPDWLDRSIFDEDFDPTTVPPQPAP